MAKKSILARANTFYENENYARTEKNGNILIMLHLKDRFFNGIILE